MPGYRQLARNRDFTLLWVGEAVSELGTSLSLFALPLVAYVLSGSAVTAAVIDAAYLFGLCAMLLPAGVIADRFDRKRVMLACSATGFVAFGSLAIAGAFGQLTLPHLGVAALVGGIATGCLEPARASTVRSVVSTEDLPTALSQEQARQHAAGLLGGPLAGLLYAVTRWLPFAVDAGTFLVSLVTVSRLRTDLSAPEERRRTGLLRPIREGFAFIKGRAFFRVLLVWASLSNLLTNALFFVVLLRMVQEGWSAPAIGATSAAAGVGGLLGAAIAPSLIHRIRTGTLTLLIAWMSTLPLVPLIWSAHPGVVAACLFGLLVLNPAGNAGIGAYRVAITPTHLQGRVGATTQFASLSILPLSPLVGGLLLERAGGQVAVASLVAVAVVLALGLSASRSIREVPGPADWERAS